MADPPLTPPTQLYPSTDVQCPTCGAANSPHMTECWKCRNPMSLPATQMQTVADGSLEKQVPIEQGWFIGALFASLLLTIVFVEMLFLAPGAGVIYAFIAAPLIGLMLRLTWPRQITSDTRRKLVIAMVMVMSALGLGVFMLVSGAVLVSIICSGGPRF